MSIIPKCPSLKEKRPKYFLTVTVRNSSIGFPKEATEEMGISH